MSKEGSQGFVAWKNRWPVSCTTEIFRLMKDTDFWGLDVYFFSSSRSRDHEMKLVGLQFKMKRRCSSILWVADLWDSLLKGFVGAKSLTSFKRRLLKALEEKSTGTYLSAEMASLAGSSWADTNWWLGEYWEEVSEVSPVLTHPQPSAYGHCWDRIWGRRILGLMSTSVSVFSSCFPSNQLPSLLKNVSLHSFSSLVFCLHFQSLSPVSPELLSDSYLQWGCKQSILKNTTSVQH